jgi:hypothetical protein
MGGRRAKKPVGPPIGHDLLRVATRDLPSSLCGVLIPALLARRSLEERPAWERSRTTLEMGNARSLEPPDR